MQGVCRCLVVLALAVVLCAPMASAQVLPAPPPAPNRPIYVDDRFIKVEVLRHWQRVVAAQSGVRRGWRAKQWRVLAAAFLIEHTWIKAEAKAMGVKVRKKEVRARARAIQRELFPRAADWRAYLRRTRSTMKEVRHAVRIDILSTRISGLVTAGATSTTEAQMRLYEYRNERTAKYRPRTKCTKRWRVVEFCA